MTLELPDEVLGSLCHFLAPRTLFRLSVSCRYGHCMASMMAEVMLNSAFQGMWPMRFQGAVQLSNLGSLLYLEADSRRRCTFKFGSVWPALTRPCPTIILDSQGPFFLEFSITTAWSANGTLGIGLVDGGVSCLSACG